MIPLRVTTLKLALATLCGYEMSALAGAPWPTVTAWVHAHRDTSRACRLVVWGGLVGLGYHLLKERSVAR